MRFRMYVRVHIYIDICVCVGVCVRVWVYVCADIFAIIYYTCTCQSIGTEEELKRKEMKL